MAQSCSLRLADMADEGGFCTDTASAARRIVDDVVVRARNCWDAVRQGGVPTDLATQREITDLVRALDSVETTAGVASAEERLLSGDGLSAEDLPALSMANEDLPFEVVVTEEAVTLKSGHACYSFATAGTAAHFVFEQNGVHTNMGVWVTPSGLEGEHGWLRARRIEDIRIVQEDPETKSVEFAVKLYGSESLEDVTGLDVSVRATIERGVAGVQLASALRNHTDRLLPGVVWFWAINVPWYTLPDGRTERPRAGVTPQGYDWVYLHRYDNRYERGIRGYGTGGGGVVVADFPHIAYDESEAQVLADPISQDLQSGGEMPIGWTAYPQTDRFLWQRLRWYRQYASLAAQTVTSTRLGLETPASVVAGVPADITVRLAGGDTEEMEGIELRLSGSSGVRHLEVVAAGEPNDRSSEFSVSIPGDLEQGARVDLCATASADGAQMPLHLAAYATLFVRPPVEVVDLRQAPAADGGLGFVARLRNNLTQELTVALTLSGEALPAAYSQTAVLAAEGVSSVRLAPPGALVPADVDEVSAELSISYDVRGYEDSLDYAVKVPLVPQAVCRITEDAPTLDGLLDDTCWETATKLVGFADPRTRQLSGEPTVCYVAADDMNLYVALDCQEMDVDHLRTDAQPNRWGRNPDVPWGDDCVQIDVDPRVIGQGLFRLALNSAGTAKSTAPGGWEAAIAIGDGRWVVEMKIPSEILGARPQAGAVWGFNANRNDSGSGRSAWSRTHGWWSSLQQFGGLLFTE